MLLALISVANELPLPLIAFPFSSIVNACLNEDNFNRLSCHQEKHRQNHDEMFVLNKTVKKVYT